MKILSSLDFPLLHSSPVIGVLTPANPASYDSLGSTYCMAATNARWLQGSGAQVVPVVPGKSEQHYRYLFESLNGLLIPGGSGVPLKEQFQLTMTAKQFVDWGKSAFDDDKDYFPIWGMCLGLQVLLTLDMLDANDMKTAEAVMHKMEKGNLLGSFPHTLTEHSGNSRLLQSLPAALRLSLGSDPVSPFIHAFHIPTKLYSSAGLGKKYNLLGTRLDRSNVEYVTLVESRCYPVYATMSHYEKTCHQWTGPLGAVINRSPKAVQIAQGFGNFFVQECCKNAHRFPTENDRWKHLIDNFSPIFTAPKGYTVDNYYGFS